MRLPQSTKAPNRKGRVLLLAGVARFELTNKGVKVLCLTAWRYPYLIVVLQDARYCYTGKMIAKRSLNSTGDCLLRVTQDIAFAICELTNKGVKVLCLTAWRYPYLIFKSTFDGCVLCFQVTLKLYHNYFCLSSNILRIVSNILRIVSNSFPNCFP